jgi:anaerobic magnesium-protoporphyrin IX monomethyl ester cyclase
MRVLLVQSYLGRTGVSEQLVFPIGLCCVATALLRAGHETRIVDLNAEREPGEDAMERLKGEIRDFGAEVVGVSLRNLDSTTRKAPVVFHSWLRPTLAAIRQAAPEATAVLGGPGFTQAAATLIERHPFDFGVQAEAEITFPELLSKLDRPAGVPGLWYRDDAGRVAFSGEAPLPDFSALPSPRRDLVDWEIYRKAETRGGIVLDVGVETTRGCPRRCAYCNYPKLNGRVLRKKPPEVVADEVEALVRDFGVRQFTFTDSRFNEDPAHARAVCEALEARHLPVRWVAWLGFSGLDEDLLRAMRAAGCQRVSFSPDGLLAPSLDRMGKDTTTEQIAASVRAVARVGGIRANWSFFCTPPSTSVAEQFALLAWYAWIHATLKGRGRMTLTWCRVEEGTRFAEIAAEDGVLEPGTDMLPEDPEALRRLFYVPPGFARWSDFWDRFLDAEMQGRVVLGRMSRPLRRFGLRDLTPAHLRGRPGPAGGPVPRPR